LLRVAYRYIGLWRSLLRWELMEFAGDTKAGTLIATDRYGNKYFENLDEELPCEYGFGMPD